MSDTSPLPPPQTPRLRGTGRSFPTARTILALMMREMQTTYGRNVGGYLWAFLEPIGAITFFTLVIAVGLRVREPGLGNSFPLFYATGFIGLSMVMTVERKIATALKFSRALLTYPGVEYTDALLARFFLTAITEIMVAVILFALIHAIFDVQSILDVPSIVEGMILACCCGFGIGVVNCYLFSVLPLWESAWSILTRPLFLISTIFFTFESVGDLGQSVLWWNPIVHCIGLLRRGFYATYDATWVSPLYVVFVALATTLIGLMLLDRYHADILNR